MLRCSIGFFKKCCSFAFIEQHWNFFRWLSAAVSSAFFLFISFPPFEYSICAYIGVAPLLMMAAYAEPRENFKFGWLGGFLFWLATLFWLTRVTVIGWILLAAYCALYFGFFAMLVAWWWQRGCVLKAISHPKWLLLTPALWVGLEYLRAVAFTGFPWNAIGVTQYESLPIIQSASWGGVYAVSYFVMLVNTLTALLLLSVRDVGLKKETLQYSFIWIALAMIFLWVFSGLYILLDKNGNKNEVEIIKIAAIQPNIPQKQKWDEESIEIIYERIFNVLDNVLKTSNKLDLIVFPETIFPDFLLFSQQTQRLVSKIKQEKVAVLVGSMDMRIENNKTNYYNSSFLFLPDENMPQKYDKRHLVMFGEYVPFEKILFFVRSLAPIGENFTAGKNGELLTLPNKKIHFASLICFEDVMAYLSRRDVQKGARLLINQTNDGWFDPYWGARQHFVNAIFRTVENKVPMVRVTNTGITCFIDHTGKVVSKLSPTDYNLPEKEMKASFLVDKIHLNINSSFKTFYTKNGDIFAKGMLAFTTMLAILFVVERIIQKRRSSFYNSYGR